MPKLQIIFFGIFLTILASVSSLPAFATQHDTFGKFEVGLPGMDIENESIDRFVGQPDPILRFINSAVNAVIAVLVIIGLITVVIGGYVYMTAGGDASKVKTAKEMITAALLGIFLSLVSVIILNTINKYIGSDAEEPKLGAPSGATTPSGPSTVTGPAGTSTTSTSSTSTATGPTAGLPASPGNTALFFAQQGQPAIEPSTLQTATIIIDGSDYYIRDSNGFDQPTDLTGVGDAAKATQDSLTNMRLNVYRTEDGAKRTMVPLTTHLGGLGIPVNQIDFKFITVE